MTIREEMKLVKLASPKLAATAGETRDAALEVVSEALLAHQEEIFAANRADMEQAEQDGVPGPILKRLKFDEGKMRDVIAGIRDLVAMQDPLFRTQLKRELD
ncbi:MAG: gamma-glutamyl-phosphate reductase, partial [Clostridiales bacterium]|nr:gamma-glutamyl-phosphate reductase [Clostridiales bacterium]